MTSRGYWISNHDSADKAINIYTHRDNTITTYELLLDFQRSIFNDDFTHFILNVEKHFP